ncbi:hypothetical protein BC826DRAFT_1107649 [Russula brevipes]|nr:hypothetical protein BC826DRAFT_1107649 [Russula brevipes]
MSHPDHSSFQQLFDAALQDYERQTGIKLIHHPLAKQLEACESMDSVTNILQEQARGFHQSSGDHGKIMKSLKYAVDVLDRLSTNVIGPSIGLSFPPASVIFTGFAILLSAAKDVSASHEALVDLLEFIETFLIRLEIYTNIPPTTVMTGVVVKIMVELLSTLAVVTKQISQGRPKKFLKKLIGEKDVEAVLQKLDRLAQDESRTTAAQSLQAIYSLFKNMRVIMDDGKAVADDVRNVMGDKLQRDVRKWLSAPDPWMNHNTACDTQQKGSATWFIKGDVFSEWKSSGASSLLFIHGKPGAGKTVFCSSIIQDISCRERSEPATVAFFYCDFRDVQKKDLRGLLSSLLVQLCDQSDDYFALLHDFYSAHRSGSQHARDSELEKCLKDMLKHPGQATVYVVIDALDEFPSTTGTPSPRDKLLKLVKDLIELKVPNLRICVTSRPEADIVPVLNPLASHSISLHDESGQIQDITEYVKSIVNADHKMRQWKETDKELVIDALTEKADGMFRWVICQWDDIRYCPPVRIRRALDELPETLDDTYARTLKDIRNWEDAHRLFQCISAAPRPLRVEELAEFLAFNFDGSSTPTLEEDHRLGDPAQAVLSTCSV